MGTHDGYTSGLLYVSSHTRRSEAGSGQTHTRTNVMRFGFLVFVVSSPPPPPKRFFSLQTGVVPAAPHLPGTEEKEKIRARQSVSSSAFPPEQRCCGAAPGADSQLQPVPNTSSFSVGSFCALGSSRGIHLFPGSAGPAGRVSAAAAAAAGLRGAVRSGAELCGRSAVSAARVGARRAEGCAGPGAAAPLRGGAGSAAAPAPASCSRGHVGEYACILRQCLYF